MNGYFEKLTVFLLHRNDYTSKAVRLNPFMPNIHGRRSVYGISDLGEKEIWVIGVSQVAAVRQIPLRGRGDFLGKYVAEFGLNFVPDPTPHPRHANLEGWPEAKEDKKSIAQQLAFHASLVMKPEKV